jgi:hypothetical protein
VVHRVNKRFRDEDRLLQFDVQLDRFRIMTLTLDPFDDELVEVHLSDNVVA